MAFKISSVGDAGASPAQKQTSLGPRYQAMLDANPYRNQNYTETAWQRFLSNLGFRTQADAWRENMSVQAAEYDASIAQKAADEEYNSPSAQVERMRAAGLNPDIDGGSSINSGEAVPLPQDPSTPMQSTGSDGTIEEVVNTGMQVAQGCMSIFNTAIGFASGVQGIKSNFLSNRMKEFELGTNIQSFAEKMFPYFLPNSSKDATIVNPQDWHAIAIKNAETYAGRSLPKKFRQQFLNNIQDFWSSAPVESKAFKEWADRIRNRKDEAMERHTNYAGGLGDIDSVLDAIFGPLGELNEELYSATLRAEKSSAESQDAEGKYTKKYYDALDPFKAAGAQNSQNELAKTNNDMVTILNRSFDSMLKKLEYTAHNEKGWAATAARIALPLIAAFRLMVISNMSVSASSSVSPKGQVSRRLNMSF